jgi:hypothetical protein
MRGMTIWAFAFGYFACYVPYSALTKALTRGTIPAMAGVSVDGFAVMPLSAMASLVGMLVFISAMGWWKHLPRRKVGALTLPMLNPWLVLSGLCTSTIIMTTTLAYTFKGVSIVFAMLLMKGGVLILAPVVDALTGRHVRWFSWAGLLLSLGSLFVAVTDGTGFTMPLACTIDVVAYLLAYFIRLRFMSRMAKSDDENATLRYFVQEQITATPALVLALGIMALIGDGPTLGAIRDGFTTLPFTSAAPWVIAIGLLSQGTGVFGSLIFLDKRENTYCVPVNRCSSVMAGVVASFALSWWLGMGPPKNDELFGAAMIIGAILFLTLPPMFEKRRASALA